MASPVFLPGESEQQRVQKLNQVLSGKLNASDNGTVTLAANQDTTTLQDSRISEGSIVVLAAFSETASQDEASAYCWVSAYTNGSATITHLNRPDTDRIFKYVVIG